MVRVKMLTHIAGDPSYASGQVVDLEPRIAKAWIAAGYATPERMDPKERAVTQSRG